LVTEFRKITNIEVAVIIQVYGLILSIPSVGKVDKIKEINLVAVLFRRMQYLIPKFQILILAYRNLSGLPNPVEPIDQLLDIHRFRDS
jgi:hypothetical protein